MLNFEFQCPTRVVFGKNSIAELSKHIDKSKKILITYGGGSIKNNGVYEQVKTALSGYNVLEFGGIEANPVYETLMKAVEIVKTENVDLLLAVGGGSVVDGTKFISIASKYFGEKDTYEHFLVDQAQPLEAIDIADVITLPATGSEMNNAAVISRKATDEKLAFHTNIVIPKLSIIDPQVTFSLPEKQTINGIVDTFVHVMEQYCTYDVNTPIQDSWMLGILKTLVQEAPKVLANPTDYDARANIFWAATTGLNHWCSLGTVEDWATHMIGHELTAFYKLDHGQTLAIVMPRLLENQKESKMGKLAKLAREVFGCCEQDQNLAADCGIKKVEGFFNSLGMKTKLSDYNVNAQEAAEKIRDRFIARNTILGEKGIIDANVTYDILIKA
ncbi:MAG: iron-containing alcohol dehydrogenase [Candidatus Gastranaerophilales bacterium]